LKETSVPTIPLSRLFRHLQFGSKLKASFLSHKLLTASISCTFQVEFYPLILLEKQKSVSAWAAFVKTCTKHSLNWTLVAEPAENPSPVPSRSAPTRLSDPPAARPGGKPKPQDGPKWNNMTLDEMKSWLEEAKRLDCEQNETIAPR
jgi:hypothetical protein